MAAGFVPAGLVASRFVTASIVAAGVVASSRIVTSSFMASGLVPARGRRIRIGCNTKLEGELVSTGTHSNRHTDVPGATVRVRQATDVKASWHGRVCFGDRHHAGSVAAMVRGQGLGGRQHSADSSRARGIQDVDDQHVVVGPSLVLGRCRADDARAKQCRIRNFLRARGGCGRLRSVAGGFDVLTMLGPLMANFETSLVLVGVRTRRTTITIITSRQPQARSPQQ